MRKLWQIFIAIFVFSVAILGWVGTEIFRQAPLIPREVVTTEGQVLIAAEEISNGQNVWPDSKRVVAHSNALLKTLRHDVEDAWWTQTR
jgi:nitric oxide reductase large subunit